MLSAWVPDPDMVSRHERHIDAPLDGVWGCLLEVDLGAGPVARWLLRLRGIRGRGGLVELESLGFVRIETAAPERLVFALAGRFWRPGGGLVPVGAEDIAGFDRPGHAVAVWGFALEPGDGGTVLTTETRVRCVDDRARRSFLRYWRVVGPFSGVVRRSILGAIARCAEAPASCPRRQGAPRRCPPGPAG